MGIKEVWHTESVLEPVVGGAGPDIVRRTQLFEISTRKNKNETENESSQFNHVLMGSGLPYRNL